MLRRKYVTALLAGGIGALAGCGGDGEDVETMDQAGQEGTESDSDGAPASPTEKREEPTLPPPRTVEGETIVSAAIADRRSRRDYAEEALTTAELGQLLWAGQGITKRRTGRQGLRAAPSAGATYPLDLYAAVGETGVENVDAGVYEYHPAEHEIERIRTGDVREPLATVSIDQSWIAAAPVVFVVTAVDSRTTEKYGDRGRRRYVPMEAGHVGQNIYLQAESLGLSTVTVGAFRDGDLLDLLHVPDDHRPLYVIPVGRPA